MGRQPQLDVAEPVLDEAQLASELREAGMPPRRSEVYARHVAGMSNTEIADELDITPPSITEHIAKAEKSVSEARKLVDVATTPNYVTTLTAPQVSLYKSRGEQLPKFSLHNPGNGGANSEYVLGKGTVIEGLYSPELESFLLELYSADKRELASGYLVDRGDLVDFISEWIIPGRFNPVESPETVDKWFLTDVFAEQLESDLETVGITPVEVALDDRFRSPITDTGVYCGDSALTGRYKTGFYIAYRPTNSEIAQLLADGDVDPDEAERITHKSPETLSEIVES